jgi:crotonobetainyl-CoA:carnitine CoA-transferase CaiB-like acyl-CoA transferase
MGDRTFFDWLNCEKLSYAVEFDRDSAQLRKLLATADVVVEGSRPAALSRRGLGPHDVPGPPGRVWLRISGYGTRGDDALRPAFGDDAAVAGGLVGWAANEPTFCGDAIADPLTGLTAAHAVVEALSRGGGRLIEIAMAEVAATYAALPMVADGPDAHQIRSVTGMRAHDLGADNAAITALLADRGAPAC